MQTEIVYIKTFLEIKVGLELKHVTSSKFQVHV